MSKTDWIEQEIANLKQAGLYNHIRTIGSPQGAWLVVDGKKVLNFCSNNYLGLANHPALVAAAKAAADKMGIGPAAVRSIAGTMDLHVELEKRLAAFKGVEAAITFQSGFAANLATIPALVSKEDVIFSDRLNHASIIDGCRLSRSEVTVYRHGDPEHVDRLLDEVPGRRAVVVTDSVFSMDGDVAPVDDLAEVCARHDALLVIDEAHAVLGPDPELTGSDALRVGTLSKTLGSLGGFVAGPRGFTDLLVNRARSYIFTTASTPADAAAALAALAVVRSAEGDALRDRLRAHVTRVRPGHPSPIIPVVIGDEHATLAASSALLDQGFFVPAIRPPTVAPGTSRLRVALSAAHSDAQVDTLARALAAL